MSKNSKKYKKGLVALIVIVLLVVAGVLFSLFSGGFESDKISFLKKDYIAVLSVEGTIQKTGDTYNQDWILSNISRFKADPKNKAIVLFIDSPGGTVYEADETYLALQDYKTSGKKIYAYMGSLAASGGYYIACAADKIYANRNTLTGSIGVIAGQFIDITEFLEDHGIYYETIHAGRNKNMGNYNEPVTEEQYEIMQSVADECYNQFTSIVSTSRHIPYKEVLPLCDGRIYTATQALKNGLIDGIGTWDDFMTSITNEDEDLVECKTVNYKYEREKGFFESLISTSIGKQKADSLEGIPAALWEQMNVKGPLYMYKN